MIERNYKPNYEVGPNGIRIVNAGDKRREMDVSTSSGRAQHILDELIAVSQSLGGIPVKYEEIPKKGKHKFRKLVPIIDRVVDGVSKRIKKPSPTDSDRVPPKSHDLRGLTGYWHNRYYKNGLPQPK